MYIYFVIYIYIYIYTPSIVDETYYFSIINNREYIDPLRCYEL